MLVESTAGLNGPGLSVVIPGIDDIKEHVDAGPLKISSSALTLSLGLKYAPALGLAPPDRKARLRLMFELGGSRLDPDLSMERELHVASDGSRLLIQEIDVFNRRIVGSHGVRVGWEFAGRGALEFFYRDKPGRFSARWIQLLPRFFAGHRPLNSAEAAGSDELGELFFLQALQVFPVQPLVGFPGFEEHDRRINFNPVLVEQVFVSVQGHPDEERVAPRCVFFVDREKGQREGAPGRVKKDEHPVVGFQEIGEFASPADDPALGSIIEETRLPAKRSPAFSSGPSWSFSRPRWAPSPCCPAPQGVIFQCRLGAIIACLLTPARRNAVDAGDLLPGEVQVIMEVKDVCVLGL